MASRWSNPSGQLGIYRFRVWPAGEDKYNHIELAQNWEKVDAMIGVSPDGTQWPPTEGVNGGLYAVVKNLKDNILPIGMMLAWHRPSLAIPIPTGFAICDGTTLSASEHSFPGISSPVTLPDLRNRFIIGADYTKTIGQSGVSITDSAINSSSGAPGPQGVGGSNTATISTAAMPAHSHSGEAWSGWSPIELMWYQNTDIGQPIGDPPQWERKDLPTGGGAQPCHGVGGWQNGQHRHKLENLSTEGSGAVHDNRPAYVGLIWIMKVKNIG
jgi:hypothetical protein